MSSHKVNRHRMFLAFAGVCMRAYMVHLRQHGFLQWTHFLHETGGATVEVGMMRLMITRFPTVLSLDRWSNTNLRRFGDKNKWNGWIGWMRIATKNVWRHAVIHGGADGKGWGVYEFISVRNDEKRWNTEVRPKVELKGSMFYWEWNGSQTLVSSGVRQMSATTSAQQKDICAIFKSVFIEWPCNFDLFRLLQILVVHVV